ncbi:MAG: phosphotransferase [Eubacteriales bacterium]|nr:phosphotransferase [Eubacteriales bacterium]
MKHILTITDKEITGSDKLSAAQPRIAVNAILFDADENIALCYMGKYDLHTLPGGGVEVGEDLHTAIKREIWEETGCQCEIIGELGQITENRYEHDFTQKRSYYTARIIGEKGELHLTDEEIAENASVVWLPIEQALRIISKKEHDNYQRKFIQKRDIAALTEAILWMRLHDILSYDNFVIIEPINKGQSNDKKYYIETTDGKLLLLRVTDIAEYDRKKAEYEMMARVYELGVVTPQPVDFGLCNDGKSVYSLSGWLDGEDAESCMPSMSEAGQYSFGLKAGAVLRKIHTLSAPDNAEPWCERFRHKVQTRIDLYNKHGLQSESGEKILKYLHDKQGVLDNRQQTFWHGDFNVGNHMIMPNGEIATFDYNYWNLDYGDPWWEFVIIPWGKEPPAHYFTGMINGYFSDNPPREFFDALSYYYACDALSALCYTFTGMENGYSPDDGKRHMENILRWFDNMNNPVPTWYLKDFYVQWVDGIPYKLKAPFDFSFLRKYGKVFKAFDEQGSGNISFGIENGDKKYFIKFAGAPKPNYISNPDSGAVDAASAIRFLKAAVQLYTELAHPTLIKFVSAEEIGGGYAAVFDWENAIGIEPKGSPDYMKFMQMPIEKKMRAFEDIVEFHAHVAVKGYVALDFYDGSILYDYDKEKVIICDIDLYQKSPFINANGLGIVGSARYVSPEECVKDTIMDEITNVYTIGATAFALFAYGDRSREAWPLSDSQYATVKKAVNDERSKRQQSIAQFIAEWEAAR